MYEISEGDFILSGIDARNGAFGIVPKELDGAIITNDFWCFEIDETKVKKDFFYWLTTTPVFLDACQKSSRGETQRIRLQRDLFNDFVFHFPSIEKQNDFLIKIKQTHNKLLLLQNETATQTELLTKLRQAILQEAVEGKLTADWKKENPVRRGDPDYDAAALLKKIQAEKEKLIKEGKIKKQKPLAPIKPEDLPFELPEGWVWTRLGNTGIIVRGKSPKYSEDSDIVILNQKCIRWYTIEPTWAKKVDPLWASSVSHFFLTNKSDILINSTGDGTIGRAAIVGDSSIGLLFDSHVLKYTSKANERYMLFCLNSEFCQNQVKKTKGATTTKQTELGVNNLSNFLIPLPPLAEQKAIVSRVEKLLGIVDQLEKETANRREQSELLMQAVLREAFAGGNHV